MLFFTPVVCSQQIDSENDKATKTTRKRRTFGNTPPGKIEHNNGRGFKHCGDERAIDLAVGTIADWAGKEEVSEL